MPEKNPENTLKLVALAGEIVAAYVSNNSVPPTALPELMASVHGALVALDGQPRRRRRARRRAADIGADPQVGPGGRHRQLHRWPVLQDPEAPSHRPRPDAGALSRALRPAGRLPDDRTRLRRAAFGAREGDRPRRARRSGRSAQDRHRRLIGGAARGRLRCAPVLAALERQHLPRGSHRIEPGGSGRPGRPNVSAQLSLMMWAFGASGVADRCPPCACRPCGCRHRSSARSDARARGEAPAAAPTRCACGSAGCRRACLRSTR